jgi:16S rRNA (cytosine1402-N4)-methyltransferase
MRFDRTSGKSAFDLINYIPEKDLITIILEYGEERSAPKIVAHIVKKRKEKKINTTHELVKIIDEVNNYP